MLLINESSSYLSKWLSQLLSTINQRLQKNALLFLVNGTLSVKCHLFINKEKNNSDLHCKMFRWVLRSFPIRTWASLLPETTMSVSRSSKNNYILLLWHQQTILTSQRAWFISCAHISNDRSGGKQFLTSL